MSSSWNSVGLAVLYQVLGWVAFAAWSFSFYPQVLLNYKRKSVVGLNFDFLVLNLTKHSSYLIYNAALFFSPFIQQQYHDKYGDKEASLSESPSLPSACPYCTRFCRVLQRALDKFSIGKDSLPSAFYRALGKGSLCHLKNQTRCSSTLLLSRDDIWRPRERKAPFWSQHCLWPVPCRPCICIVYMITQTEMIPVAANDVAFSLHAVALTAFTVFQVFIYERGTQKVSKVCISISAIVWTAALVCLIIAWPKSDWLWLIDVFNSIQVGMTAIKYIPQAIMNFKRKSTIGWSVGNILLDLTGGVLNFCQMGVQSIDQHTLVNFYGNIGKTLLSLETVFFDVLFIIQHYVLYPVKKDENGKAIISERVAPLIRPSDKPEEDNV